MREISLDETPSKLPVFSFLLYGPTRSGKTHFLATLPRPLIYADASESGYKTIMEMDRSTWFEPELKPIVVAIDQMNDISAHAETRNKLIASGRVKSIIFDAWSFYCDFFLAQLMRANPTADNRHIYGDLGKHLREVRVNIGKLDVNVGYGCLEKPPDTDDPVGKPMIPGQQSGKFAAGVDFLWHTRVEQKIDQGKIVSETREARTRQHGKYIAGNRLGMKADMLPDPFVGTYADLLACLGYDVELLRKSLPKPNAAITVAVKPPTPVAKPPVTQTAKPPVVQYTRPTTSPAPAAKPPQVINNPASRGAKP